MILWVQSFKKSTAALLIASTALLGACGSTGSSSSSNSTTSRRADMNGMYRVKSGDTLVLIARANGVSYTDIMRWNNLTNPNNIEVGWRLRVRPNASGATSTPSTTPSVTSNGNSSVSANSSVGRDPNVNPQIKNNVVWGWPAAGNPLVRFNGDSSKGIVLDGKMGDPVFAAADGEVIYAGSGYKGYGQMVVVKHNDTWSTVYANNSAVLVSKGQQVRQGQTIAKIGDSDAQRTQLYFEVRQNARPVDPLKLMPTRGATPTN